MSPAGSYEGVVAAVRGGADAVYFGGGDFNARRGAKNLSDEEIAEALRYCRLRGVKTYITLNTLVTDRELSRAAEMIKKLNAWGADALIVQDMGIARAARALAPELPLHASTQMSVHNLGGVLAAQRLGFSRVVLARELSMEDIRFICRKAPIEIEVFCHGALCMCHSGQCYMSSAIGGRSGNRGMCAQPCRMVYSFLGSAPDQLLSLKDQSLAKHLNELEDAGVTCVKIEGRMKRPEYTALVTSIYRRALESGAPPSRNDMEKLQAVFSRSGFTDGYITGKTGEHMFGARREEDVRASRETYREARQIYESEPEEPRVAADFFFSARTGENMALSCMDEQGNTYSCTAPPAERAVKAPTGRDDVRRIIGKTGGTVFYPRDIKVELDEGLRIPASALSAMRRQCTDSLTAQRRQPPRRAVGSWQPGLQRLPYEGRPGLIFSFLSTEQITDDILALAPEYIYLPLREAAAKDAEIRRLMQKGFAVAPVMDRVIRDSEWAETLELLRGMRDMGIESLVCTNLGQIFVLESLGFDLRGDFGLNVFNSQTMRELKTLGLTSCTVSPELQLAQIRDLSQVMDCELLAYGRLPLMITENCVIRRRGTCSCGTGTAAITDRTGRSFPLMREHGCRNTVYNSEKLYLADKMEDLGAVHMRWLRLSFTTENRQECLSMARAYAGKGTSRPENMTRGLYYRGVQ